MTSRSTRPRCVEPLLERFGASIVGAAFPAGFFDWKRVKTTLALYGVIGTAARTVRMAWASLGGGVVHRQFAARHVPVRDVADVNAPEFLDELRRLQVDLIVSLNTPQKLKRPLLALPTHGCINVHFGMLPRYRGILPIFYALMNGESSFGVTVHVMDEKLDNGDIVAQRAVPIAPGDDLETLYPKGFAAASDAARRGHRRLPARDRRAPAESRGGQDLLFVSDDRDDPGIHLGGSEECQSVGPDP